MEICVAQQPTTSSNHSLKVKSEYECDLTMSLENGGVDSSGTDTIYVAKQDAFDDSLDYILLSERRKMLLSRLLATSSDPLGKARSLTIIKKSSHAFPDRSSGTETDSKASVSHDCKEDDSSKISFPPFSPGIPVQISNCNQKALEKNALLNPVSVKVELLDPGELNDNGKHTRECFAISHHGVTVKKEIIDSPNKLDNLTLTARLKLAPCETKSKSRSRPEHPAVKAFESPEPSSLETGEFITSESIGNSLDKGEQNLTDDPIDLDLPSLSKVKGPGVKESRVMVSRVKVEPLHLGNDNKLATEHLPSGNDLSLKPSLELSTEVSEDDLDHMPLIDRMKLLSSEPSPATHISMLHTHQNLVEPSKLKLGMSVPQSGETISFPYPRKRRKSIAESPLKALEEDAPELWKVLVENCISTEEMKLYGEPESGEVIDDALCEGSFAELEAVMWRVFPHHPPVMKLGSLRKSGILQPSYCVGCLLSLVEQAQFLRDKKWPVEWGWSRDLRAFIFVFQNHNRIVLERPEYGYATYFFEMMDGFSIDWQIRRLVIAMRLTNGGRVTVLENKPLMVGEDVSEGEARVLEQYGWVPNTGLGTMLNYSDRVTHDIKNERNGAEWRSRIRDLLIKGYKGGVVVPSFLQAKNEVVEHEEDDWMDNAPQVKLELL